MKTEDEAERKLVPLPFIQVGRRGRVVQIDAEAPLQRRLHELGLLRDAEISVLSVNGSLLCQVSSSRFGIDRTIAECVKVVAL